MLWRFALTLFLSLCGLSVSFSVSAFDIKVAEGLCYGVAEDDAKKIKKTLRKYKVRLPKVYQEVQCNGRSLLKFALERHAYNAGKYLVEKLPDEMLNDAGPDGYMVLSWGEFNGYKDSPILKEIRRRL
ncbi:DUF3718 domain-containing protein [Corallincola platygyrae]|uniref:DUF3718 domain-containing protein n=1 Tax=Corallincola platygyrae TaxID=1193278 RepID=A0ABW4XNK2_9GAMM